LFHFKRFEHSAVAARHGILLGAIVVVVCLLKEEERINECTQFMVVITSKAVPLYTSHGSRENISKIQKTL